MNPLDVRQYLSRLESYGLTYLRDGEAIDMVVVDQRKGITAPCKWLEFGQVGLHGGDERKVSARRLKDTSKRRLMTPDGWSFEDSISSEHTFVEPEGMADQMTFLRRETDWTSTATMRPAETFL